MGDLALRLRPSQRGWKCQTLTAWIVVPINYFWRPQYDVNWARGPFFQEQHAMPGLFISAALPDLSPRDLYIFPRTGFCSGSPRASTPRVLIILPGIVHQYSAAWIAPPPILAADGQQKLGDQWKRRRSHSSPQHRSCLSSHADPRPDKASAKRLPGKVGPGVLHELRLCAAASLRGSR